MPGDLDKVVAISAGDLHSIALRQDGSAVGWGMNDHNQTVAQPASLGVQAIAAGADYNLMLIPVLPPAITAQSAPQNVATDSTVRLSATATGTNLSYQWRKDGAAVADGGRVSGATTSVLTIVGAQLSDAGSYVLAVTNDAGVATTTPILLQVGVPPTFSARPLSSVVAVGQPISFTATVADPAGVTFQWKHDGVVIPGETAASLSIAASTFADGGRYEVIASNGAASSLGVFYLRVVGASPTNLKVVGWGSNTYGQLNIPSGLGPHVVDLAASDLGAVALNDDGSAVGWGFFSSLAVAASPTSGGVAIAAATSQGRLLVLRADGTVFTAAGFDSPVTQTVRDAVAIAASDNWNYALLANGTVVHWTPTTTANPYEVVPGFTNITQIAAGTNHVVGVKRDGTVVTGDTGTDAALAVPVGLTHAIAVAAGSSMSAALTANGQVVAWGDNYTNYGSAMPMSDLASVVAVTAHGGHGLALKSDGTLRAWGILIYANIPAASNSGIITMAAGTGYDVALAGVSLSALTFAGRLQDAQATVGSDVTFDAGKATSPLAVTYRWQRQAAPGEDWQELTDGGVYSGTGTSALTIHPVSASMDGVHYRCTARDGANVAHSISAALTVRADSPFAGTYFGTFTTTGDHWALRINRDNTGRFIAYLGQRHSAIVESVVVDTSGLFTVQDSEIVAASSEADSRISFALAEAAPSADGLVAASTGLRFTMYGQIAGEGVVSGYVTGLAAAFSGTIDNAEASVTGGMYQLPSLGIASGSTYTIVGPSGQAMVVVALPTTVDGATCIIGVDGSSTVTTSKGAHLVLSLVSGGQSMSGTYTPAGSGTATVFTGLVDGVPSTAHLVNIASRADGGTGNNVAIGGFGIAGSGTKRLLLRAVGPTLATQGLGQAEVMADPTIELHDALNGNKVVASIDNWGDNADPMAVTNTAATVGAAALSSFDAKSAATLLNLPPGVYTFLASGKNSTSGIVLIEVYDADGSIGTASLVNISTRAYCSTGNNVTIGGFAVNGNAPKHLLLRAVGPTLATQGLGVSEVLADPAITVYDTLHNNAVVATNDNWGDNANSSDITTTGARVGATPLATGDTKSSAMLITLQPGVYSFVASGKNGTSGIVLVEVYDAD